MRRRRDTKFRLESTIVTEKLFYKDPYKRDFDAVVTGLEPDGKKGFRILLDRTCFYPEGGGQPSDSGDLNGVPVLDVRKEGDEVVHLVGDTSAFAIGGMVHGVVDWERRYDFMQQHTGQHLISAAFFNAKEINTVSVHLGDEISTVELDVEKVEEELLIDVERAANLAICMSRPIMAEWVIDNALDTDTLRRAPKVSGEIRVVSVEGTDRVACGGVHVGRTGEVGLVKLVGTELIRGHLRTIWKIGARAYEDYRQKDRVTSRLTELFSAPLEGLAEAAAVMVNKLESAEKSLRAAEGKRAKDTAREMIESGDDILARILEDEESKFLKAVANALVSAEAPPFCLLSQRDGKLFWFAGDPHGSEDLKPVIDELLPLIDGKGGGRPPLWQGVGNRADGAAEFLSAFKAKLAC